MVLKVIHINVRESLADPSILLKVEGRTVLAEKHPVRKGVISDPVTVSFDKRN